MDTSIQNHLLPGEDILWDGQPNLSRAFNAGSAGISIFGIIWLGFSLFWTVMAFAMTRASGTPDIFSFLFPLFGLPFVAIGVFMVFFAPAKQKEKNQSTYYYVTNKRIIIHVDTRKSPVFNSLFFKDIQGVQIIKNRDNTGNIVFTPMIFAGQSYSRSTSALPSPGNCFYRIESAEDVHKLILLHQQLTDLKSNE